jgi:hypothetical protein
MNTQYVSHYAILYWSVRLHCCMVLIRKIVSNIADKKHDYIFIDKFHLNEKYSPKTRTSKTVLSYYII